MEKFKKLVDEVHEIIGVLLAIAAVVLHQLDKIGMDQMLDGFVVAGGVYLGAKGVSAAADFIQKALEKRKEPEQLPEEPAAPSEDTDGGEGQ